MKNYIETLVNKKDPHLIKPYLNDKETKLH